MKTRTTWSLPILAAFALTCAACGSDGDGGDSSAGAGGSAGGTAGTGGGSGETIKIGATFVDYVSKAPIEALQVCTIIPEGRDPGCAETIATGQIVAEGFPSNSELLFELNKDAYLTTLIPAVSGEEDDTGSTLFPVKASDADLLFASASLTLEAGKGSISFIADQSKPGDTAEADGQPDVEVTVSPAGGGTMAFLDGLTLSTSATATFDSGLGVVVNLDPGEYELTFTHADHTCTTRLGWSTGQPNVSRIPVEAGKITYVLHQCGE